MNKTNKHNFTPPPTDKFRSELEMRDYLVANLRLLEKGLRLYGNDTMSIEYPCRLVGEFRLGCMDILAEDEHGAFVVIECKFRRAMPSALGQLIGYMVWVHRHMPVNPRPVRGMIVARRPSPMLRFAVEFVSQIPIAVFACPDRSRLIRVL